MLAMGLCMSRLFRHPEGIGKDAVHELLKPCCDLARSPGKSRAVRFVGLSGCGEATTGLIRPSPARGESARRRMPLCYRHRRGVVPPAHLTGPFCGADALAAMAYRVITKR